MKSDHGKIRFLIQPNPIGSNAWLALREDLIVEGGIAENFRCLARRFEDIQVWFSDLDDFDTHSPAKIIAMKGVGAGRLNPAYALWAVQTILLFCRYGKKRAEAMSWKRYYDAFLKRAKDEDWLKDEAFRFIDELLTPEGIARLLFPAVPEFYAAFKAEKYLVTRNLERIAYRYSRVLPYSAYFHEVKDKAAIVESFLVSRPDTVRYGLGGDSEEDAEAAAVLEFYHRVGKIEKPLCLCRASYPLPLDRTFNIFVGKDRSGLSGVLSTQRPSRG